MSRKRFVSTHRDKERKGSEDSYWTSVSYRKTNDEGEHEESVRANPDALPEMDPTPSNPELIMGEAIEHLQGRQKEVYFLAMREGKSETEIAEILGIDKSSAHVYKIRAIKFIELYCREAIARGRV